MAKLLYEPTRQNGRVAKETGSRFDYLLYSYCCSLTTSPLMIVRLLIFLSAIMSIIDAHFTEKALIHGFNFKAFSEKHSLISYDTSDADRIDYQVNGWKIPPLIGYPLA